MQYKVGGLLCKSKYLRDIWIYTIISQYLQNQGQNVNIGKLLCKSNRPKNYQELLTEEFFYTLETYLQQKQNKRSFYWISWKETENEEINKKFDSQDLNGQVKP